ncbi:MAG: hypothetical protein F8N37_18850 [Telmatospirillum sp.]|nr:hypothetical protein [Telmatospirillum sp.]
MNLSRSEQRVLHVLAQGGLIRHQRVPGTTRISDIDCFTRDGYRLGDCTMQVFEKLRRKRLIRSEAGGPYRISRQGREAVRPQPDNR